jgi:hypothetical protein
MCATIAKEFGVLPSVVRDDLENDPDQLALAVMPLLSWAEAKAVHDAHDENTTKAYRERGHNAKTLARVERYYRDRIEALALGSRSRSKTSVRRGKRQLPPGMKLSPRKRNGTSKAS